MENRKEKMELLRGLTIGRDDTANIKPLQQVNNGNWKTTLIAFFRSL